jgi:arylsulfatase A-like enzyme
VDGRRPNIVLVTVDALRADHLGCYGYDRPTSPRLDGLAGRACRFARAWATGPNTPHACPGLMASRLPFEGRTFGVRGAPLTLAQMLGSLGYRTQAFMAGNAFLTRAFGYDRGFDAFADGLQHWIPENAALRRDAGGRRVGRRVHPLSRFCRRALAALSDGVKSAPALERVSERLGWLWRPVVERLWHANSIRIKRGRAAALPGPLLRWVEQNRAEPFFLWVHPMCVHDPYAPPPDCQQAVNGRVLPARRMVALRRLMSAVNQARRRTASARDVRDMTALYDAEVRRADALLGRLFDALRGRGWWEDALVIVTADHGEALFEHGRFQHPSYHYDELLRVPLLVKTPGQREGREVGDAVGLIDLAPTLADLLGFEPPAGAWLGSSFAGLLRDPPERRADGPFYVAESFHSARGTVSSLDWTRLWRHGRRVSLQGRRFKLMVDCATGECRAFDLGGDPGEQRDLVPCRPELAEIGRRLARLQVRSGERARIRSTFPAGPPAPPFSSHSAG